MLETFVTLTSFKRILKLAYILSQEKYGPKGASYKKENVQAPVKEYKSDGVDLNLGLSIRPPWNCRYKTRPIDLILDECCFLLGLLRLQEFFTIRTH